jgi:hypothetical protein
MATEQLDPRALLAKMDAEEKAAREKAEKLAEENAKKKAELLAKLREADLADVIAKCKLHEFTATDLRGALKVKGGGRKTVARKSTARKTSGRGRAKKSAT